jgi:hypothetical protein
MGWSLFHLSGFKPLPKHLKIFFNTDGGNTTANRAFALSQAEQQAIFRVGFCEQ